MRALGGTLEQCLPLMSSSNSFNVHPPPATVSLSLMDKLPWSQRSRDMRAIQEIAEMESDSLSDEAVTAARARRSKER